VESFDCCQYKAERGIRVDGYNFVEEDGVLNLFISDFRNSEELTSLTKTEISAAFRRLENFFSKSLKSDFYPQLEETSQGYGLAHQIYDSVDLLRFKKSGYKILWIVCLTHTAYCANFFEKIVNQQSHLYTEKQFFQNQIISFEQWPLEQPCSFFGIRSISWL